MMAALNQNCLRQTSGIRCPFAARASWSIRDFVEIVVTLPSSIVICVRIEANDLPLAYSFDLKLEA